MFFFCFLFFFFVVFFFFVILSKSEMGRRSLEVRLRK